MANSRLYVSSFLDTKQALKIFNNQVGQSLQSLLCTCKAFSNSGQQIQWLLCVSGKQLDECRVLHFAGIGFSAHTVKLDRLPGWEPHSYGYHGDDGMAFESCGTGKPYGPVFATGKLCSMCTTHVTLLLVSHLKPCY